jgi:hypothetical protein
LHHGSVAVLRGGSSRGSLTNYGGDSTPRRYGGADILSGRDRWPFQ